MNRKIFNVIVASVCVLVFSTCKKDENGSDLVLKKVYKTNGVEFAVQSAKITKDGYKAGTFTLAPPESKDPSYNSVLCIEITLQKGKGAGFYELDMYLANEKGVRDEKANHAAIGLIDDPNQSIVMFNVPTSARKIKFGIGNLELNLEKVL